MTKDKEEKGVSTVENISLEIKKELSNEAVSRALVATTFKGLDDTKMRQALMEGMIAGFEFKDFLKKDVYAIPYSNGYSLVTSIDYSRKIAMRSGQMGKDAPIFTYDDGGKIESCSVTVYKNIDGQKGGFTATVYMNEYSTGKNLWASKPRTMLAKVAEMHALRMAFPEQLAKQYVEEEVTKVHIVDTPTGISDEERNEAINSLEETKTKEELIDVWASLTAKQREDAGVKATYTRLSAPKKAVVKKKEIKVEEGEASADDLPEELK